MNEITATPATAKEKLALSRAELLAAMGFQETLTAAGDSEMRSLVQPEAEPDASKWRASFVGRWWHRHPARSALELLEPGLARYASRKPGLLVTYAAGAGCLLVLLRPWRLLSIGAVITLLFRASDIQDALSSRLHRPEAGMLPAREPMPAHAPR